MIWLTSQQVASLLGITEQAVRKAALEGRLGEVTYEEGPGKAGRQLRIPLSGLPAEAQAAYLRAVTHPPEVSNDFSHLPEVARRKAGERLEVLSAWAAYRQLHAGEAPARKLAHRFVAAWKEQHPGSKLSVPTLYRWERQRRLHGDTGLVSRHGQHKAGTSKVPDDLFRMYCALYLHPNKRSHSQCYLAVRDWAMLHGRLDEVPHESAFRRRFEREVDPATALYAREGPKAFWLRYGPSVEQDRASVPPGALFVMDHWQFDLLARTETGEVVRPWLSVQVDFRTRRVVGWKVTARPCLESTMAAAAMAFGRPDIGIPDQLRLDNGREYTGYAFAGRGFRKATYKLEFDQARVRTLVAHLGIDVHFALPGNPRSKAETERLFRSLSESFCKAFPSYTGNHPDAKPEGLQALRKDPKSLPTLVELDRQVSDWIEHVLNEQPSSAPDMQGLSPRQAWERWASQRPVKWAPKEALKLLFMPYAEGRLFTVQKTGLTVWGQRYWSEELHARLGEKVIVRYDPTDASKVYVFDPEDRWICTADLQRPVPVGITSEELKEQRRRHARFRKQLEAVRQEAARVAAGFDVVGVRVEAGKRRRAQEPPAPAPKVVELVRVSDTLRQAAKEVAAAREQPAARMSNGRLDPETEAFILGVINGTIPRVSTNGHAAQPPTLRRVK